MSTSFCPQYISFKMNGLMGKLDNLPIHNNPNTKWVRFRGTPCIILQLGPLLIFKYHLPIEEDLENLGACVQSEAEKSPGVGEPLKVSRKSESVENRIYLHIVAYMLYRQSEPPVVRFSQKIGVFFVEAQNPSAYMVSSDADTFLGFAIGAKPTFEGFVEK